MVQSSVMNFLIQCGMIKLLPQVLKFLVIIHLECSSRDLMYRAGEIVKVVATQAVGGSNFSP